MKIAVLADIHSQHERLAEVIRDVAGNGCRETWCLGDMVGGGPGPADVIAAARRMDFVISGNHDAWMLAGRAHPEERRALRGRDLLWLSGLAPLGERHGVHVWHASPADPLTEFFTGQVAARELAKRSLDSLGLVAHTHEPALFWTDGSTTSAAVPEPRRRYPLRDGCAYIANCGSVCGTLQDPAAWWLEFDSDSRVLQWHRVDVGRPGSTLGLQTEPTDARDGTLTGRGQRAASTDPCRSRLNVGINYCPGWLLLSGRVISMLTRMPRWEFVVAIVLVADLESLVGSGVGAALPQLQPP